MGERIAAASSFLDRVVGGNSETADQQSVVRLNVLLAALGLAVLVPLAWGVVRAIFGGQAQVAFGGDYAVLEVYTLHAKRLSQLLGPYSRFHWNHPGPLYFYLLLPFYVAFGETTRGLLVGAFTMNLVSMASAVWIVRRAFSTGRAVLLLALIGLTIRFLGFQSLSDPWNPLVTVLPALLFLVLCWLFSTARPWSLLGMAILGSFLVQTHAGHASLVVAAGTTALALGLLELRRRGAYLRLAILPPLAVSVACAFLLWLPPLVEEMTRPEGNLTKIARFVRSQSRVDHGWAEMAATLDEPLASVPLGALASIGRPRTTCAVSRGLDCIDATLPWSLPTHAVLLAAGVLLAARLRRRDTAYLGLVTAAGLIGGALALRSIQAPDTPYIPLWPAALGITTYATAFDALLPRRRFRGVASPKAIRVPAASVVDLGRPVAVLGRPETAPDPRPLRAPRPLLRTPALAVAVLLIGMLAYSNFRHALAITPYESLSEPNLVGFDEGKAAHELVTEITEFLAARPGPHEPVVRLVQHGVWPVVTTVVLHEYREGRPVRVEPNWLFMFGEQFAPNGGETEELLFGWEHFHRCASQDPNLTLVGESQDVYVYHRVPPVEAHPRCPNLASIIPDE